MSLPTENKYMSYRDAILKGNSINNCKNIKATAINRKTTIKQPTIKHCKECKYQCVIEQNDGDIYEYIILTLLEKPKGVIWSFETKYSKDKKQDFLCLNCSSYNLINCSVCGNVFNINSTTSAYDDPELKKAVDVCLQCNMYEACGICGYLGGATPCRWCRFM